jgi:D-alanyl-D-alanine carboxypeptidase/D-alanyl-D-alanine-endopeptidase (penicillin-binding protein 4)
VSPTAWRAVAAGLGVAGLVCLGLAIPASRASGGAPNGSLGTPLWSARRVPTLVGDAAAAQHLQRALDGDVGGVAASCFVVAEGRQPLVAHAPDSALIPASTEKLLTATAALHVLGPDFRYETKVVAAAPPAGGTEPQVWMVGAGDSVLATGDFAAYLQSQPITHNVAVTTRLEPLADAIVNQGVRSIPGGVVGDDARYDAQRYLPSWPPSYRTDPDIGPLGALTVNGGYKLVGGSRLVPVDDPALAAAQTLTQLLQARGVQVGPASAHQPPPAAPATVASVSSPPLRDILTSDLRASNNLTGELLVKELGVRVGGQGTTSAGVRAITSTLQGLGVPTSGLSLVDGSGLDRGDRVSCRTLAGVLDLAAQPAFRTILDALPVAGEQGTLAGRLQGTPLAGKLRAKTGTLSGVGGLAGVLDVGRPLRFALLLNGNLTLAQAMDARERFAVTLATFPDISGDALVPAPAAGTPRTG